ncbi:HAD domain-containing protein [Acrocarpospora sp. B8E8]|uniref:HAD domain-containing protein n=1 Tax=Acrocarpospora sp. B8E8 TaxID=3153572 RepID=UPI00325D72CA
MTRPLILLDIDGCLNRLGGPAPGFQAYKCMLSGRTVNVLLNPGHGPKLLELADETGAELVWATAWTYDANKTVGPLLALPELPVIDVHLTPEDEPPGGTWKLPAVAAFVNRRPFVWFDDDLTVLDSRWLADHPNVGPFQAIVTDEMRGITDDDIAEAAEWLHSLREVDA